MTREDLRLLVVEAPREALPDLIGDFEAAKAVALARLATPGQPPAAEDDLLTMPQVAKRLAITEHQAREMGRRGELPVVRVRKRHVRVNPRALEEWIERGTLSHPREGR